MALKISHKNATESQLKRSLKLKIKALSASQQKIAEAADNDLKVFDDYRKVLRSKSKSREIKLNQALKKATDCLLDVCSVLFRAIKDTEESIPFVRPSVISDLEAGKLILEAVYKGILALANGNIQGMPEEAQLAYEKRRDAKQARLEV